MELREGQHSMITAALKTASGHDAAYEKGSVAWSVSGPEAAVEVDPDNELSATLTGVDGSQNAAGILTFTADGDPDVGEGEVRQIIGTLDYVITQGEAVVVELTAGPAEG